MTIIATGNDRFDAAFQTFFDGCVDVYETYRAKNFPNVVADEFSVSDITDRTKYVRVVRGGSVHCFVEIATGNVLKAAGYKTPAKHARGNIYETDNGLTKMGPYGPAYLR